MKISVEPATIDGVTLRVPRRDRPGFITDLTEVERTPYVLRRIAAGDLVIVEPAKMAPVRAAKDSRANDARATTSNDDAKRAKEPRK